MPRKCSFCNEVENPQRRILANENDDAFICEYCVEGAYSIIYGEEKEFKEPKQSHNTEFKDITPKELKAYLDRYVIGQDRAKKVLALEYTIIIKDFLKPNFKMMIQSFLSQIFYLLGQQEVEKLYWHKL